MKTFIIGVLFGCLVLFPLVVFLYVKLGFLSLATTAKPLPLEEFLARTALHASIGKAKDLTDKSPVTDENMLAGAREYRGRCAVCHGLPGQPKTQIAAGMFPKPPQLFEKDEMVTDDPEGETFWKVTNGIRLSGMTQNDPRAVPAKHRVETLYHAEDVETHRFGGEGTGGQSLLKYNWKIGQTYRFLVEATVEKD